MMRSNVKIDIKFFNIPILEVKSHIPWYKDLGKTSICLIDSLQVISMLWNPCHKRNILTHSVFFYDSALLCTVLTDFCSNFEDSKISNHWITSGKTENILDNINQLNPILIIGTMRYDLNKNVDMFVIGY